MRENYPSLYQKRISEYAEWLNVDVFKTNIAILAEYFEREKLILTDKKKLFSQLSINYGIAVLPEVLVSLKEISEEKYLTIKKYILLFLKKNSIEAAKNLFGNIIAFEDLLFEGEMELDSYALCLHASCVLHKTNQELLSYSLYDWFDLILEGEGISNVFTHRQAIYEWSILDVLPSAVNGNLPKYIFFFNDFIPTVDFLSKLAN